MEKVNKFNFFGLIFLFLFLFLPLYPLLTHSESLSSIPSDLQFTRNLGLGNRGQDVENLQCVLGVADPTGYYGVVTSSAVLQYQNTHAADILTPVGLTNGTGYFGNATRAYLNAELQNASSTNATSTPTCPTYIPPTYQPQPTPTPNPYPQPQPTPPQPPITQLPPQQPLPLVPVLNPNGSLSYYNPNSQPVQNPYGTFTSPYSTNTSLYPNSVGSNNSLPYATDVDPAALQNFVNSTGWVSGTDKSGRPCQIDPVIEYLIVTVPKLFPWAYDLSDCRSAEHNAEVSHATNSAHIPGEAVDFASRDGQNGLMNSGADHCVLNDKSRCRGEAEQLIIWLTHNAATLQIRQIIFDEKVYNFTNGVLTRMGTETDHYDHVHVGR